MKFVFLFLGKTREKYLNDGIRDYVKRLERFVQVDIVVIRESVSKKLPKNVLKQREAEQLLNHCSPSSLVVALDPHGTEHDSIELAALIGNWEDRGIRTISFLIGGHCGLHENVLNRADSVLSLSRLTFTHEMTRLILLEQLYRGWMIKSGRSYHY